LGIMAIIGGGDFWAPVGVAISGVVAAATILAFYFVPSAFTIITRRRHAIPTQRPATGTEAEYLCLESRGRREDVTSEVRKDDHFAVSPATRAGYRSP
jgi:hypothetical protein